MSAIKLHDKGKYNLAPDSLPHGEHQPGAVPFRGAKDTRTLSALIIMVVLAVPTVIRCGGVFGPLPLLLGCAVPILLLFPHELLHAICFRENVYRYTAFKQGLLFVVGSEPMSRAGLF
ncbi:MAG: hypothetical protein HFJ80_06665 [Clostridiales bacterium]|nr:hypothetical protein [Clostridiales bacterium]